ncbi:MAG: hypothetical protein WCY70_08735 [Methanoculleus sp.]
MAGHGRDCWRPINPPVQPPIPDKRNPEEDALIALTEREIIVHREHAAEYGYAFFILREVG